jgi:hypothetical protein
MPIEILALPFEAVLEVFPPVIELYGFDIKEAYILFEYGALNCLAVRIFFGGRCSSPLQ